MTLFICLSHCVCVCVCACARVSVVCFVVCPLSPEVNAVSAKIHLEQTALFSKGTKPFTTLSHKIQAHQTFVFIV